MLAQSILVVSRNRLPTLLTPGKATALAGISQSSLRLTCTTRRMLSDVVAGGPAAPPVIRRQVSLEERARFRAARKARASQFLNPSSGMEAAEGTQAVSRTQIPTNVIKYLWYLGFFVPTGLLVWGFNDETSPPAKFSEMVGLTDLIRKLADPIVRPAHAKLLPDWDQLPNVPPDIPVPHTLVLDLEETLVSSSWDRKYGHRYAKRPGVDKFLQTMAQYYEIVVYTPSTDGIADPVVSSLDKSGCIMHRIYRDGTHYVNGTYVKELNALNRNINRMILIDDDPLAAQFNPDNLIRIKPYEDATDRTDNTLERITPFLVEIARKGYDDVPSILRQYRGMDADQIADEYQRRLDNLRTSRIRNPSLLGGMANRGHASSLPPPEMTPTTSLSNSASPQQLTAKDLVGAPPSTMESEGAGGMVQWMNRRAKEKEEEHMRKMEKWNEIMMKKQQAKRASAAAENH